MTMLVASNKAILNFEIEDLNILWALINIDLKLRALLRFVNRVRTTYKTDAAALAKL
jgi:hypothetical protein